MEVKSPYCYAGNSDTQRFCNNDRLLFETLVYKEI